MIISTIKQPPQISDDHAANYNYYYHDDDEQTTMRVQYWYSLENQNRNSPKVENQNTLVPKLENQNMIVPKFRLFFHDAFEMYRHYQDSAKKMLYFTVDCETTGVDFRSDKIVQLCIYSPGFSPFDVYIKNPGYKMSPTSEQLTGINLENETVRGLPVKFHRLNSLDLKRELMRYFWLIFASHPQIEVIAFAAKNAYFDYTMLSQAGIDLTEICFGRTVIWCDAEPTMRTYTKIYELSNNKLGTWVEEYLNKSSDGAHGALFDSMRLYEIIEKKEKKIKPISK